MTEEQMVVVYEAPSKGLSIVVKSALEQVGIPVLEKDLIGWEDKDTMCFITIIRPKLYGYYSHLLTFESRAEEARQIVTDFLAAYERGDLALSDDTIPDEQA